MVWRCNQCGYMANADDEAQCAICGRTRDVGASGVAAPAEARPNLTMPAGEEVAVNGRSGRHSTDRRPAERSTVGGLPVVPGEMAQHGNGNIFGRITHLERHDERPPVDFYGVIGRILFFGLILIPYLILFVASGILSFVFAFLGFPSLCQLFNPIIWTTSIFELLEILVLRRMRGLDTAPFFRGIIEDENGREYDFSFRGPLARGNLITGHAVALSGRWSRGTLEVREGRDRVTGAVISSRHAANPWRFITLFLLCIYVVLSIAGFRYWNELARVMGG